MRWIRHVLLAGLPWAAGCASPSPAPPPDRDPANASAPEAAWEPPPDRLGGADERAQPAPPKPGGTWTCPMHPQVKAEKSGKCPTCGMDLIPEVLEGGDKRGEHNHK